MVAWYEIVVKGSEQALRALVAGCEGTLGGKERAIFGHDLDLEAGRFSQRLRELFAARSHHLVFASGGLLQALVSAVGEHGPEAGLRLERVEEVLRGRLRFSAEAFSREVAETIRKAFLAALPPGVAGEGIDEHEEIDRAAGGAELYSPEHAFTYRVRGAFVGPLPGVIEMQRRASTLEFVTARPLELETRAVRSPGRPTE